MWCVASAALARQTISLRNAPDLGFDVKIYAAGAHALVAGASPYSVNGFVYPPFCALFVWPLHFVSASDVPRAGLLMNTVGVFLLAVFAGRAVGDHWFGSRTACVLLVMSLTPPVRAVLALGNLSCLIAVCFALFLMLAVAEKWATAGAVVGVSLAIKPMLLPIVLVFAMERRWRGLATAIAVPSALVLLSAAIVREPWRFITQSLPFVSTYGATGFDSRNAAIGAVFRVIGLPSILALATQLFVAILALAAVVVVQRHEPHQGVRVLTTSSVLMATTMLVGTLGEDHYVLLLVPLFAAVGMTGSYLRWWSAIPCFFLLTGSATDRIARLHTLAILTRERFAGLLLLIVAVLFEAVRRHGAYARRTRAVHAQPSSRQGAQARIA